MLVVRYLHAISMEGAAVITVVIIEIAIEVPSLIAILVSSGRDGLIRGHHHVILGACVPSV